MPALVTGASGFLGGRVAQLLHQQGEQVILLARPTSSLDHLSGIPYTLVRGELSDRAALREALQHATRIFHCAACSTDWASQRTYLAANVTGTAHLLATAQRAPRLERFVHVSTTDIYGYPEQPCSEDHPSVDADLPYNQTKSRGEALVWTAHHERGLPITILRPATIFGPRGKDFTQEIASMLRQRLMLLVDSGRSPGGFTYVDNVANAMIAASTSPATVGQAYNLADGTGATWKQYLTLFARILGTRPPWLDLSFAKAMSLASALEAPHRLFHLRGRPLLTRHAVLLLARNQEFPIEKARQAFGFHPAISLEEGLERSVAWLRDPKAHRR